MRVPRYCGQLGRRTIGCVMATNIADQKVVRHGVRPIKRHYQLYCKEMKDHHEDVRYQGTIVQISGPNEMEFIDAFYRASEASLANYFRAFIKMMGGKDDEIQTVYLDSRRH